MFGPDVRTMPRAMAAKISKLVSSAICFLHTERMPRRAADAPALPDDAPIIQRQVRETVDARAAIGDL